MSDYFLHEMSDSLKEALKGGNSTQKDVIEWVDSYLTTLEGGMLYASLLHHWNFIRFTHPLSKFGYMKGVHDTLLAQGLIDDDTYYKSIAINIHILQEETNERLDRDEG